MFVTFSQTCFDPDNIIQSQVLNLPEGSREACPLHDPFHLVFVQGALTDAPWMKHTIFGTDSQTCKFLPNGSEHNDPILELFKASCEYSLMADR